jgi:hypothetical protein
MEFAAAALASVAEAGMAAGTAAATAATGPAGVAGLASFLPSVGTAASVLSGGATVLSVLNANRAGEAKAMALDAQADDAVTQSRLEAVQGLDRRTSLKAAMAAHLGNRDVATAASGTDLSFGTPVIARAQEVKEGERALSIDQDTEDSRVARLRERSANYRIQARQASAGGLGTAAALALQGAASFLKRG